MIDIPKETLEIVEGAQYKTIAALLVSGVSPSAISKQLKMTRYHVNKIMSQDDFKGYLKDLADSMVSTAVNTWKSAMGDRIAESLKVIDHHLKENNLEAVKIIVKSIGIEKQEVAVQSSNLTVVLPDYHKQPKDIDV